MVMNQMRKRVLLCLLALGLLCLLAGCRMRVTGSAPSSLPAAGEAPAGSGQAEEAPNADAGKEEESPEADGNRTRENPQSDRREYDENAEAEIVPGTDRVLAAPGEDAGAPHPDGEPDGSGNRLDDAAEHTALLTVASEASEKLGVSEQAGEAESAMTYFTVLLEDRTGSLFECKRLNAYWETEEDYWTIHKSSSAHALVLQAGCYDVSSRLLPENLAVDDGWVIRKNPGVIVKVVESDILGRNVTSASAAAEACRRLMARDGWNAVEAVREGRVLLLSRELFDAPYLQTAAAMALAKAAYPSLFADVQPEEALRMLSEEAAGTAPAGIFCYLYPEDGP